ncbi:hypothetical protein U14_00812 [Candidatus Moduliflexus flocculans]|uniref:DUF2723 domain-containing protein n=1 Tax=Candidatus Moduliflexus flocculans TaxID=1499966 RepID=A0A0S6VQV7_9BACT|nr:hypothetical protein U14_00812 [Candidatus Moduliflexus flocculans]
MKRTDKKKKIAYAVSVFLLSFSLYFYTLPPTFLWSDSSKLALEVKHRDIYDFSHGYHPLHTVIGIIFSYLPYELAVTQHILSSFFAAAAIVILFLFLKEAGFHNLPSIGGALILSVSHSFWLYAVITETYSLHAFFLATLLWLTQKYRNTQRTQYLLLICFFLGLSFYNHSISAFFILPIGLLVFGGVPIRIRHVGYALLAFLCGISPLFLVPMYKLGFGATMEKILHDTHGHITLFIQWKKILTESWKFPLYLLYQFPCAIVCGVFGIQPLWKKDRLLSYSLLFLFTSNTAFAMTYFLQRQFALLIASYLVFAVWIAAGFEALLEWRPFITLKKQIAILLLLVLSPVAVYMIFPRVYKMTGIHLLNIRNLPYRDSIEYFFTPSKRHLVGAYQYAKDVFDRVDNNAIIFSDFNIAMALQYYQEVYNVRPDVTIMQVIDSIYFSSSNPVEELTALIHQHQTHPLYFADTYEPYYFISQLENTFKFEAIGAIVKIHPLDDTPRQEKK